MDDSNNNERLQFTQTLKIFNRNPINSETIQSDCSQNEQLNFPFRTNKDSYINNIRLVTPTYAPRKLKPNNGLLRAAKTLQIKNKKDLNKEINDIYFIQDTVDIDLIHNDISIIANQILKKYQYIEQAGIFKSKYQDLIKLYSGYVYLILILIEFPDFNILNYIAIPYSVTDISKNKIDKKNTMICKRNNIILTIFIIAMKLKNKEIQNDLLPNFEDSDFNFLDNLMKDFKNNLLDSGNYCISYEVEVILMALLGYRTEAESVSLKYHTYFKELFIKIGIEEMTYNNFLRYFIDETIFKENFGELKLEEIILYRKVINSTAKRNFFYGVEFLIQQNENVLLASEGRIWKTIGRVMSHNNVFKLWETQSKMLNKIVKKKGRELNDIDFNASLKFEYGKKIWKIVEDEDSFKKNSSLRDSKKEEYRKMNYHKRSLYRDINLPFVKSFLDLLLIFFKYNLKSLVMFFLDKRRKINKEIEMNEKKNSKRYSCFSTKCANVDDIAKKDRELEEQKMNSGIFETCLIYDEDICMNVLDSCINNETVKSWYVHFCLWKKYFRLTRILLKFEICKNEIINFDINKADINILQFNEVNTPLNINNPYCDKKGENTSQMLDFIKGEDDSNKQQSDILCSSDTFHNSKNSVWSLISVCGKTFLKKKRNSVVLDKSIKYGMPDEDISPCKNNNLQNFKAMMDKFNSHNSHKSLMWKKSLNSNYLEKSSAYGLLTRNYKSNENLLANLNTNKNNNSNINNNFPKITNNSGDNSNNKYSESILKPRSKFSNKMTYLPTVIENEKSQKRLKFEEDEKKENIEIKKMSKEQQLHKLLTVKKDIKMSENNENDNNVPRKSAPEEDTCNIIRLWKDEIKENEDSQKITNSKVKAFDENIDKENFNRKFGDPILRVISAAETRDFEANNFMFSNLRELKKKLANNENSEMNDVNSSKKNSNATSSISMNLKEIIESPNHKNMEDMTSEIRRKKINTTNITHYFLDSAKLTFKNEELTIEQFKINTKVDLFSVLIENIRYGYHLFDILSLLEVIPFKKYKLEMCEKICQSLNSYNTNEEAIITCSRPLLSLALAAELLYKLGNIFNKVQFKMESVAKSLLFLAYHLQTSLTNEDSIIFYLKTQTDINGRSALEIYAENRFFDVLEDPNVGLLIGKLWNGTSEHEIGIFDFWRITRILKASIFEEQYDALVEQNLNSFFSFQFYRYSRNCSERNFYESLSTMAITLLYQYVVYAYVTFTKSNEKHPKSHHYYIVQQVTNIFMLLSLLNDCNSHIFFRLTGRKLKYNVVQLIVNAILFIFIIINFFDLPEKYYPVDEDADWNIQLDGVVYSVLLLMAWMKVFLVLMITKLYGPFIRVMFSIFWHVVSFFIVVICITFLFAQCFCLYFKNSDENYKLFFESFLTLFNTAWGQLDFTFTDLDIFGEICLIAFTTLSNIILFNLIVAIVNNIFDSYHEKAEAESRAQLVLAHERKKWDDRYGLLILFPSPINIFSLILIPFLFFSKKQNQKKYNVLFSKICYFFIAIIMNLLLIIISIVCYFFTLIKSIIHSSHSIMISPQNKKCHNIFISILKRPFELLLYIIQDCYFFWKLAFKEPDKDEEENTKEMSSRREYIIAFRSILIDSRKRGNKSKISVGEAYRKLNIRNKNKVENVTTISDSVSQVSSNVEEHDNILTGLLQLFKIEKSTVIIDDNKSKKEQKENSKMVLLQNNDDYLNDDFKSGNFKESKKTRKLKSDNTSELLQKLTDPFRSKKTQVRVQIKLELKKLIDKFVDPEDMIDIERTLNLLPDRITYDNDFMEYLDHFNVRNFINGIRKYYFSLEEDTPAISFQRIYLIVFKIMLKLKLLYNYLPDKTLTSIKNDFAVNNNIKKYEKTPELLQLYEEKDNMSDYDDEGKYIIEDDFKTDLNTVLSIPDNYSLDKRTISPIKLNIDSDKNNQ